MEAKQVSNKYYVYLYLDSTIAGEFIYGSYKFNYQPFYVGQGFTYRSNVTTKLKRNYGNFPLRKKINDLINNGKAIVTLKYKEGLSELESIAVEKDMIKVIGRLDLKTGPLLNMTDGGRGIEYSQRIERSIKSNSRRWLVTFPDGKQEVVTNLREFCRNNNLTYTSMRKMAVFGKPTCLNKTAEKHIGFDVERIFEEGESEELKVMFPRKKEKKIDGMSKENREKTARRLRIALQKPEIESKRLTNLRQAIVTNKDKMISALRRKLCKTWEAISPSGELFIITDGLEKFCHSIGINPTAVYKTILTGSGKLKCGWSFRRL